ncbi:hypothetical protein IFM89_022471 [Coptis chinensis]|uniref:Uncharacterized protein n=1 Tax=Coptis chinensis TaxID=261450 RepID=A0A835IDL9_9MAGN|nr:hypothetical protein IFM89_022471 [Coptis chinensis]
MDQYHQISFLMKSLPCMYCYSILFVMLSLSVFNIFYIVENMYIYDLREVLISIYSNQCSFLWL